MIPGDKWGLGKVVNLVEIPNEKTDANNQHAAFVSSDLPEENWAWPTAGWAWRDKFATRLREYTEGHCFGLPKTIKNYLASFSESSLANGVVQKMKIP